MTDYARLIRRLLVTIALASLALPAVARAQDVVELDEQTGTPRVVAELDGTLTGPRPGDPEDVALRYVTANLAEFGLDAGDLATLQAPTVRTAGAITEVRWRQAVDGIPAADAELRVNLTRDGRVLNVLGSPAPDLDPDTAPQLTAGEAVRAVQRDVGVYRSTPRDSGPRGATRATEYTDGTQAELALYRERLAWRVTYRASSTAVYHAYVDADTGRVLSRANLVKQAAPALVWEQYPGATQGGTQQPQDLEALGYLPAGASELNGDYVHAWSDLDDDNVDDGSEEITREAGTFAFPFQFVQFNGSGCSATAQCSWAPPSNWTTNRKQNAVQAFYFANRFRQHLEAIGFPEGFAGDKLLLQTDDGANSGPDFNHINNANMFTPPKGERPVMQMYLFRGDSFRDVNGGDDAAIVYHEYAHGLSSRLITDASGAGAVNSAQAGAMGEGWSDWYAKDFIVGQFPSVDTAADGDVSMGVYTDEVRNTIRTQPLDCPVGAAPTACPARGTAGSGGYTYGDFGRIFGRPEVHADGEIWAQTLWDLRGAIGATAARQLITGAMRISPPEPSFLDMRNAILQADQASGGTRRAAIWAVFAARGMGYFASTASGWDTSPVEDFSLPPAPGGARGQIAGQVTDAATGQPLAGVTAGIGPLLGSPDALAATTAGAGTYLLADVPARTWPFFVFDRPGYDRVTVTPVTVAAGMRTPVDARTRRNWAATGGGADTAGSPAESEDYLPDGCGPDAAVDQDVATGWSTESAASKDMIVRLPQAVTVVMFEMDPAEACGDGATAAAAGFQVATSTNGFNFTSAHTGTFTAADRHRLNRVVLGTPRAGVTHVRLRLTSTQGPSSFMDFTEFGVYSTAETSGGTPGTPVPIAAATPFPTVVPTPTPTPTPTPQPRPAAPTLTLPASGKRGAKVKVVCRAGCRVTGRINVSATTARKLGLGRSRIAGSFTRTIKAGTTTLTLKLKSSAARRIRKLRSFRGTLQVSVAYAGTAAVTRSRRVVIKR